MSYKQFSNRNSVSHYGRSSRLNPYTMSKQMLNNPTAVALLAAFGLVLAAAFVGMIIGMLDQERGINRKARW